MRFKRHNKGDSQRLIDANNKQFGIVVLKFSSVCKTAWAKMTLDKAVFLGLEANAYLKRNTDGKELSCSPAGGKGKVLPGQTSCYTPMVDFDPRSSYAM
ncbi:hypothetical protein CHCC20339_1615 [Bacillus licheniformis]|nr:hypothetical protein CHCC20339_1615 [Bacillus licheniformis]